MKPLHTRFTALLLFLFVASLSLAFNFHDRQQVRIRRSVDISGSDSAHINGGMSTFECLPPEVLSPQQPGPKFTVRTIPPKVADPAWRPPAARATPAFLMCHVRAHGTWNQGVCKEARKNLKASKVRITYFALVGEMQRISEADLRRFQELVEVERLRLLQRSL